MSEAAEHADSTVSMQDKFHRMFKLQSRLGDWELIKPGRCRLVLKGRGHCDKRHK